MRVRQDRRSAVDVLDVHVDVRVIEQVVQDDADLLVVSLTTESLDKTGSKWWSSFVGSRHRCCSRATRHAHSRTPR